MRYVRCQTGNTWRSVHPRLSLPYPPRLQGPSASIYKYKYTHVSRWWLRVAHCALLTAARNPATNRDAAANALHTTLHILTFHTPHSTHRQASTVRPQHNVPGAGKHCKANPMASTTSSSPRYRGGYGCGQTIPDASTRLPIRWKARLSNQLIGFHRESAREHLVGTCSDHISVFSGRQPAQHATF